jgi:hypothetical protein
VQCADIKPQFSRVAISLLPYVDRTIAADLLAAQLLRVRGRIMDAERLSRRQVHRD